jgi:hypothetical protein
MDESGTWMYYFALNIHTTVTIIAKSIIDVDQAGLD